VTNFIFASLCDNDFGPLLQAAVYHVETHREVELAPEEFKEWVLDHMVFHSAIRRIHPMFKQLPEDLAHTRAYLSRNLIITYVKDIPAVDHDGGSVIMDVNLSFCWQI
jgi:hypothetical protein